MRRSLLASLVMGSLACSQQALAGMPHVLPIPPTNQGLGADVTALSQWAIRRLDAISFFLVAILICAGAARYVWNSLQRDFPAWPRLTYRRSLGLVLVWGCLFIVVLTMISGARELMTPGAWERQGQTYRLKSDLSSDIASQAGEERRQQLLELRTQLWRYAATHSGKFPSLEPSQTPIPVALWQLSDIPNQRFQYVEGLTANESQDLLVYEPELGQQSRWVLCTDGSIAQWKSEQIAARMAATGKRN